MPTPNNDSTAADIGDDRLRGVRQIARFLGDTERRVSYLVERGIIPVGREGTGVVASKRRLREYHARLTGEPAQSQIPATSSQP